MRDSDEPTDEELERFEIADQAREVGKLTPREYAKLHNMKPQLVYYYIRSKQLELEYCICGRRVIDVKSADALFAEKREAKSGIRKDADDEQA